MEITGIVLKGKQRGKDLGFPTANIALTEPAEEGIYISKTKVENVWHNSLSFIGAAKTFNESEIFLETYIFNFAEDIYGKEITVKLLKKTRGNKKFDSVDDLLKQMEQDKQEASDHFKNS